MGFAVGGWHLDVGHFVSVMHTACPRLHRFQNQKEMEKDVDKLLTCGMQETLTHSLAGQEQLRSAWLGRRCG
jgi:hypothetical protein